MTVSNTTSAISYTGTGVTATYAFTWAIVAAADLLVYVASSATTPYSLLVLNTGYTVSGAGAPGGGTITLTAGNLANGAKLFIASDPAQIQAVLLEHGSAINPADVMAALDLLTREVQANRRLASVSLQIPVAESLDGRTVTLPSPAARAAMVPTWDASGNLTLAPYAPTTVTATSVATVTALKLLAAPVAGTVYATEGYATAGDGGHGFYYWNAASTATDNGGTVLQLGAGGTGRFLLLTPNGVMNVRQFGAKGDGATDDTAAIRAAAVVINAAGTGTLFFPAGTYSVYNDSSSADLCVFTGVTGLAIIGDAAVLHVNRTFSGTQTLVVFQMATCVNVRVQGLRLTSPEETGSNKTTRGAYWFQCQSGCRNIVVPNLDVVGGVTAFSFVKLVGDADTLKCRNIIFGNVRTTSVGYPINLQFSGDDMVVENLVTWKAYRSFLIYGVRNIRAHITAQDTTASDVVVTAFGGKGCENVDIDYHNTETTASIESTTDCAVAIRFSDSTAAQIRDIRVRVDLVYPATGWFGSGVQIDKYSGPGTPDPTDRGHVLDNVQISGHARGAGSGGAPPLYLFTVGTWGVGETVRNIAIRDFSTQGCPAAYVYLTSLVDRAVMDGFSSDQHCFCQVSTAGRLVILNSKGLNFFQSTVDASRIDFIGCEITNAATLTHTSKSYFETIIAGRRISLQVPSLVVGDCVLRSSVTKTGDLTTPLNCFRVNNLGSGGLYRVKVYAVKNGADFTAGTRVEVVAIQTFTATQSGGGAWGADLANAAEVTQRNLNGGGTVTITRVDGDATGAIVQLDVSGFNHANGVLTVELELFTASNTAAITPM